MAERMLRMDEIKGRALDDLLREVARSRETLTVVLDQGQAVEIRPLGSLKSLPELEGSVPEGWKDGIYAR